MRGYVTADIAGITVRPAIPDDADMCASLHVNLTEERRRNQIRKLLTSPTPAKPYCAFDADGSLVGYTLGFGYAGHTVSKSIAGVQALFTAACKERLNGREPSPLPEPCPW